MNAAEEDPVSSTQSRVHFVACCYQYSKAKTLALSKPRTSMLKQYTVSSLRLRSACEEADGSMDHVDLHHVDATLSVCVIFFLSVIFFFFFILMLSIYFMYEFSSALFHR